MHSQRRHRHLLARMLIVTSVLVFALLSPGVASAHPLGNFTINRYSRLTQANEQFEIVYVLDMAENPAHAERWAIDADGDGVLSPQELAAYRNAKATELCIHPVVSVASFPAPLACAGPWRYFRWRDRHGLPDWKQCRPTPSAVWPCSGFCNGSPYSEKALEPQKAGASAPWGGAPEGAEATRWSGPPQVCGC